jgi:methylated-DNA-[protein]-cysteine S-methyltransferase
MYYALVDSPIDPLLLVSDGEHLVGLYTDAGKYLPRFKENCIEDAQVFSEAVKQLKAYFAGELTDFDLAIKLSGTAFQQRVWQALVSIPFAMTASYKDIAERIESPKAVRAVGLANGRNPISIVVPCHRVIGANGTLTGYAGGLPRKRWLLAHEKRLGNGLGL